jgi:hypothetical protein
MFRPTFGKEYKKRFAREAAQSCGTHAHRRGVWQGICLRVSRPIDGRWMGGQGLTGHARRPRREGLPRLERDAREWADHGGRARPPRLILRVRILRQGGSCCLEGAPAVLNHAFVDAAAAVEGGLAERVDICPLRLLRGNEISARVLQPKRRARRRGGRTVVAEESTAPAFLQNRSSSAVTARVSSGACGGHRRGDERAAGTAQGCRSLPIVVRAFWRGSLRASRSCREEPSVDSRSVANCGRSIIMFLIELVPVTAGTLTEPFSAVRMTTKRGFRLGGLTDAVSISGGCLLCECSQTAHGPILSAVVVIMCCNGYLCRVLVLARTRMRAAARKPETALLKSVPREMSAPDSLF